MKRTNRCFLPIALLIFSLLSLVPAGQAQGQSEARSQVSFATGVPFQLGLSWTFTASSTQTGAFNTGGLLYYELVFVPTGTVSGCTLTVDGATAAGGSFTTGSLVASQTCTSAGSFATSSAAFSVLGKVTPTITGSGSVTVYLFGFLTNAASGGSSVSVTNFPGTQPVSGTVTASQATPANLNATIVQPTAANLNATIVQPTAANLNATVTGTVNTQPAGFASVVAFQQAVTASAVVLATNAVHGFCVKALAANSITVYVGPSGVSTATGYPLAAGDSICYQASNTNLAFIIASSTGASVAVSGN